MARAGAGVADDRAGAGTEDGATARAGAACTGSGSGRGAAGCGLTKNAMASAMDEAAARANAILNIFIGCHDRRERWFLPDSNRWPGGVWSCRSKPFAGATNKGSPRQWYGSTDEALPGAGPSFCRPRSEGLAV